MTNESETESYSAHGVLAIQESGVGLSGLWPGRYGAVSLLSLTGNADNITQATMKTAPILQRMDEMGGSGATQDLYETLYDLGVSLYPTEDRHIGPEDMQKSAYTDGREMYETLEKQAICELKSRGGHYAPGPFVVTARLLCPQLRNEMLQLPGGVGTGKRGQPVTGRQEPINI